MHEATGEIEDTWFASQHIPVGSLVLAGWTAHGSRHAYTWLTSNRLLGAGRRDQFLDRRERKQRRRDGVAGEHSSPAVAEAEALLRGGASA